MSERRLTDEQARALWKRAAELQVAAQRDVGSSKAVQPVEQGDLSIEHVTAAAEGAGIDADFMRIAIAEQQLPDASELRHDEWQGRWLSRIVREPHSIERERVIAAQPEAVLSAVRATAASPVYQLMPENSIGKDRLSDAVFVYRITDATTFGSTMNFADGRVLLVMIRPHERGTLLRIRVPLFRRGVNLLATGISASLFGSGAAAALGGAASALGATALLMAAPVAAGAIAGGAFGVAGFRLVYRTAKQQGVSAIDLFMQAIAAEAETAVER